MTNFEYVKSILAEFGEEDEFGVKSLEWKDEIILQLHGEVLHVINPPQMGGMVRIFTDEGVAVPGGLPEDFSHVEMVCDTVLSDWEDHCTIEVYTVESGVLTKMEKIFPNDSSIKDWYRKKDDDSIHLIKKDVRSLLLVHHHEDDTNYDLIFPCADWTSLEDEYEKEAYEALRSKGVYKSEDLTITVKEVKKKTVFE